MYFIVWLYATHTKVLNPTFSLSLHRYQRPDVRLARTQRDHSFGAGVGDGDNSLSMRWTDPTQWS